MSIQDEINEAQDTWGADSADNATETSAKSKTSKWHDASLAERSLAVIAAVVVLTALGVGISFAASFLQNRQEQQEEDEKIISSQSCEDLVSEATFTLRIQNEARFDRSAIYSINPPSIELLPGERLCSVEVKPIDLTLDFSIDSYLCGTNEAWAYADEAEQCIGLLRG